MPDARLSFEVLVVGAGPAGLAAACAAAENGRRVGVVDSAPLPGGQIWPGPEARTRDAQAARWLARFARCGARHLPGATVVAAPRPQCLLAERDGGAVELEWEKLVLATGARELFLPFPGWTLPNVLGAGALQVLVKSGLPVAGKRIVVAGSGPLLFAAAAGAKQAGADVRFIAEQAPLADVLRFAGALPGFPGKLGQAARISARLLGVPYRAGWWPVRAGGNGQVERVVLTNGRATRTEGCDFLACGFGLVPNVELPLLLGCAVADGVVTVNEQQETSVPGVFCAGETTGVGGADCALVEGEIAGLAAAGGAENTTRFAASRRRWHGFREALARGFRLRPELKSLATPDTLVCRCEDVRFGRLREFAGWRDAKLHARCGMGPCQGRICGAATRELFGWGMESVRPPVLTARVETLAGPDLTD